MNPLPPELLAKYLPEWRRFVDLALDAADKPHLEPAELAAAAARAEALPSPFGHKHDQYVGAVLIWTAKAFCRQPSGAMRQTLDVVLTASATAFLGRLERAARSLQREAPVIPLRRRADIDGPPEED